MNIYIFLCVVDMAGDTRGQNSIVLAQVNEAKILLVTYANTA